MFCLMELDLLSLKGSAVSSSRFWSVYGFSIPLGSHSSFHDFRHVYSTAASKWPSQHICSATRLLLAYSIIASASVPLS